MNIFQDESGCLGFRPSSSKYFIITLLCPQNSKQVSNIIRKFKGSLIKEGWPNTIEIKATHLHRAFKDTRIPDTYKYKMSPDVPITNILTRLATHPIEVDVIIVNKERINEDLRTLPYGVLYNFYSKIILTDRVKQYNDATLYIDRTSKQIHKMKRFDEYIYTEVLLAKGHGMNFAIIHGDSNIVRGISAVDFFSWAVSRKYEFSDDTFWQLFRNKVVNHVEYLF